jgi:hypothetical protein
MLLRAGILAVSFFMLTAIVARPAARAQSNSATTREDKIDLAKPATKKPGQRTVKGVNRKTPKKKKKLPPEPEKTFEQKVLDAGGYVSGKVDKVAEHIDLTLAGKKYTKKQNPTSVNVNQYVTWTEGDIKTSTTFGLNLRLPNLERRWQLRFSSYDEEAENRDLQQKRVRTKAPERDYGAGLFFFQKLGNIKTTFQPRLELKDPLEVSYLLRFESSGQKGKVRLAPRVDLFADPQKGTGEFVSLELTVDLTEYLDLAFQNTEEYRERENFFSTQHGVSLDYSLTDTQAVGTGITTGSNNRPSFHLDSLVYSMSYAQVIYKDLLRYGLTPFLSFTKSHRFKGDPGISLTVSVTF